MTRTIELPKQSRQVNQLRHSEHVSPTHPLSELHTELHNELHEELAELNKHHENRGTTTVSQVELERQAYRRKQRNKSIATSLISTVILVAVVVVALHNSQAGHESRKPSSPLSTS